LLYYGIEKATTEPNQQVLISDPMMNNKTKIDARIYAEPLAKTNFKSTPKYWSNPQFEWQLCSSFPKETQSHPIHYFGAIMDDIQWDCSSKILKTMQQPYVLKKKQLHLSNSTINYLYLICLYSKTMGNVEAKQVIKK